MKVKRKVIVEQLEPGMTLFKPEPETAPTRQERIFNALKGYFKGQTGQELAGKLLGGAVGVLVGACCNERQSKGQ